MKRGFITELEGFDLGELGAFDCRFYGTKEYCLETESYTVNLFQIAIPGLGDSGASLLLYATKLGTKYRIKIEAELEGSLNGL